jgi:uncharacterized caspase-like protein
MTKLLLCAAAAISGLVLAALPLDPALAQRRVALVVGNSAYQSVAPLSNTINDANAIAALFRKAGFDVVDARQNLGVVEFKRAIREFMVTARGAETAVMYFAGHGIEVSGTNYLIPVDAKLATDYDAEDEAVSLDRIILALEPAQRLRLVFLDACRDNPFLRKMQRTLAVRAVASGLGKIEPMSTDTLIAYAAKAGSVSYDGFGPNSPFTTALIKYIAEPGVDIRIALGRVRDEVLKITGRRQEPFVYGSLGGTTVSLVPGPDAKKAEPRPVANEADDARSAYEATSRVGTKEAWESFLKTYGTGFYAELARLQLDKLSAGAAPESTAEREAKARAEHEQAERLALERRQEEERRAKAAEAERLKAQREAARAERERAERLALERRQEEERRANVAEAERLKAQREAALRPQGKIEPRPEESCADEERRLARLRANPVRDEVVRFARDLDCEALRPQVNRLLESVGGQPAALAPAPTRPPPSEHPLPLQQPEPAPGERRESKTGPEPDARQHVCKREEERLAQLRANPAREAVARFARELACEELRPQVLRLLESVGG